LISLALVADTGETFYAEFTDYDMEEAEDLRWICNNDTTQKIWYGNASINKRKLKYYYEI